jgi:hypothetical protein
MLENIMNAPWRQWYEIMSSGNPPLALQFVVINSIFFVIFAVRRMRGKRSSQGNAAYAVHGILILVNTAILYQSELLPYYQYQVMNFWRQFQQVI